MKHGNLHTLVYTSVSSSLSWSWSQNRTEWPVSRKLSVTVIGEVHQAMAVGLGGNGHGACREKDLQTGSLEGPGGNRLGSQVYI